ncbi:MAG: DeoR family transcriptional regulator [Proteobacteria bacterium]|nr:DeoR family transcriptional regulator [Pseudomonadota bacterium]
MLQQHNGLAASDIARTDFASALAKSISTTSISSPSSITPPPFPVRLLSSYSAIKKYSFSLINMLVVDAQTDDRLLAPFNHRGVTVVKA